MGDISQWRTGLLMFFTLFRPKMNPERVQFIIPFQDRFNKNPASIFRSIYFLNLQISICIAIRYINGKSIDSSFFKCFIILHFQVSGICKFKLFH